MYKNQLQELAQRSCFNLPAYTCLREGPDHAPRFKAAVTFNGEQFESPGFFTTLRQAEHAAAEVALAALARRGPSYSLAARILDETGVYKNLLQEVAQRVGAPLPSYTTERSGLGHLPVFTCTVELAGIIFTGEHAKNKKQAEKNAASAAWSSLKQLARQEANLTNESENSEEQEQIRIARALLNYRLKEKMAMANNPHASPFPKKFPMQQEKKPCFSQSSRSSYSKILPLFRAKPTSRSRPESPGVTDGVSQSPFWPMESSNSRLRFTAAEAAPYVPVGHYRMPCHSIAPPVTVRSSIPVFSAPPLPPPTGRTRQLPPLLSNPPPIRMASPVRIRPASPLFAPSGPVQRPRPVMSVQMRDVQHKPIKESLSSAIPVQVKEVQHQLFKASPTSVIPIQMKDVQPQPPKEPVSLGKVAPLAAPLPATWPPVKMEAPAQAKDSSQVVTSEVPCHAAGSTVAAECAISAESTAADTDKGEGVHDDAVSAEAAEDIIKHLEIK